MRKAVWILIRTVEIVIVAALFGTILAAVFPAVFGCAAAGGPQIELNEPIDPKVETQTGVVPIQYDVEGLSPIGLTALVGMIILLSHRREMKRIQRNGRADK